MGDNVVQGGLPEDTLGERPRGMEFGRESTQTRGGAKASVGATWVWVGGNLFLFRQLGPSLRPPGRAGTQVAGDR